MIIAMWSGLQLGKQFVLNGVVSARGGKSRGCKGVLGVAGMVCSGAQNEILLKPNQSTDCAG